MRQLTRTEVNSDPRKQRNRLKQMARAKAAISFVLEKLDPIDGIIAIQAVLDEAVQQERAMRAYDKFSFERGIPVLAGPRPSREMTGGWQRWGVPVHCDGPLPYLPYCAHVSRDFQTFVELSAPVGFVHAFSSILYSRGMVGMAGMAMS